VKDQVSNDRIEQTHPAARGAFTDFINECETTLNIILRITNPVYRTIAEQDILYEQGRSLPGHIVTNAKGGQSYHNFGLAIDLCVLNDTGVNWSYDMAQLRPIAQKYMIEWGGDWHSMKDYPHFQKTFGFTCEQLLEKHQAGQVDSAGYVVIITTT